MTQRIQSFLLISLALLVITSCQKKDPEIPNEEELITTVTYTLTPEGGGETATMIFKDLDGDGGEAAQIISEALMSNTTYFGELELLNEAENPAEDITEEVEEEGADHQFFFESSLSSVSIVYDDSDQDGKPIGLKTTLVTGDVGTGNLTITLRHEPDKNALGVESGDISNAGGETDIQVTFNLNVQ